MASTLQELVTTRKCDELWLRSVNRSLDALEDLFVPCTTTESAEASEKLTRRGEEAMTRHRAQDAEFVDWLRSLRMRLAILRHDLSGATTLCAELARLEWEARAHHAQARCDVDELYRCTPRPSHVAPAA